jgi:hypothetical protein
MRGAIAILLASFLLAGCCPDAYPVAPAAGPPPFDAFHAAMKLGVGMPTDVAVLIIGSGPVSSQVKSCGVLTGYVWTCQLLIFGSSENNQLLVYIMPTPDGRGAVNSWSVRIS